MIANPISELPPSEARMQADVWKYINNTYVIKDLCIAYHIPNGGARNEREGALLRAQGVVPGVADICVQCHGKTLYIELKKQTGHQSPEQKEFERKCKLHGFDYFVIRDVKLACTLIDKFIQSCAKSN